MRENIKIFVFGLGNQKLEKERFKKQGYELVVGPTKKEHDFLMKKYEYYRSSYKAKKFSFCSDVGRLYVLSKNKGLYIDASVLIGSDFDKFIKEIEKYEVVAFRGNYKYIETGVLGSGKENNDFYKKLLDEFSSHSSIATFIMPVFLSKMLFQSGFNFGGDKEIVGNMMLLPLLKIRDKKTVGKTSGASWLSKNKDSNFFERIENSDNGKQGEDDYINKRTDNVGNSFVEKALKGEGIEIKRLRLYYESGLEGISRKQLSKDYKKIDYHVPFLEKLIGSKFYVFFTFKGFMHK